MTRELKPISTDPANQNSESRIEIFDPLPPNTEKGSQLAPFAFQGSNNTIHIHGITCNLQFNVPPKKDRDWLKLVAKAAPALTVVAYYQKHFEPIIQTLYSLFSS
ncbi:hypothetical protein [Roseateles depolymerans]|uniref:Uncharacterized protein n=2 Tax=Roseateles depolymerans TaxID=76731 RepID=A0A0U3NFV5_9BURK|nr:hypothetical protein [Roseateles depolymerans]ALV07312.1 hypothetical protein RD2015_2848 [Roseateles depolymerans]REG20296.1 hypothetical protein DES44_2804 [Roseateles depolymerans]